MAYFTGEKIREVRKRRGYNQDQLAEMANLNRVTIAKYEAGKVEPGAAALNRIADALEVTVDELLGRKNGPIPDMLPLYRDAVPIVGDIACGAPITAEQNIEGYADLPEGTKCDFALRCRGNSMEPTFMDGDLVLIRQQSDVEEGQIAAVLVDGEATLKHVYHEKDGLLLIADNPSYAPIHMVAEAGEYTTIQGMAVGYVRMFK